MIECRPNNIYLNRKYNLDNWPKSCCWTEYGVALSNGPDDMPLISRWDDGGIFNDDLQATIFVFLRAVNGDKKFAQMFLFAEKFGDKFTKEACRIARSSVNQAVI